MVQNLRRIEPANLMSKEIEVASRAVLMNRWMCAQRLDAYASLYR